MHKKDFFPSYCFHISRFQIIFPCRYIGHATATLDPRPRHWTRDPRPATISQTRLWSVLLFPNACYVPTEKPMSTDLSTVSGLANKNVHQDLMHSGGRGTAVPKACPQAFSLFPLPNSPLDQRPVHRLSVL